MFVWAAVTACRWFCLECLCFVYLLYCSCVCVRVRVRVRTTQICSYEGLHPPPTSHPLVSAEGLEPASLSPPLSARPQDLLKHYLSWLLYYSVWYLRYAAGSAPCMIFQEFLFCPSWTLNANLSEDTKGSVSKCQGLPKQPGLQWKLEKAHFSNDRVTA